MIDLGLSTTTLAVRTKHGGIGCLGPLVWCDPSDLSVLFQDAEGTVPVTSAGDPVRRLNNKGNLGGYFLAPNMAAAPTYQTDGTHQWLESDGVDDLLEFQGAVPFSVDLFEAVAFRTISINRAFAHIVSNNGGKRQPLISTPQSQPRRVTVAFGGAPTNVDAPASLIGVDVVVTATHDTARRSANVNGQIVTGSGVALVDDGTDPYLFFGPNASNIRNYGSIHLNRVPSPAEQMLVRKFYAKKSGGTA